MAAAEPQPETVLQKTAKRFALHNPVEATDALWMAYGNNRIWATQIQKREKKAEAPGYESPESEDEYIYGTPDFIYVLRSARRALRELETDFNVAEGVLQKSVTVLSCDAQFEESYDPRTVSTISRVYSPSKPVYIDVHFQYHCRMRYNHIEWYFSIGYRICTRPQGVGPNKERPADLVIATLKEDVSGGLADMHVKKGWRSIAWATWDDLGGSNFGQRRVEKRSCDLYEEGVVDIYEALFGALPEVVDARRKGLVDAVRVLLAAVGIDYEISCEDGEDDSPSGMAQKDSKVGHIEWMLSGQADDWLGREVRRACGFQLARDPVEEEAGKKDREEELNQEDDTGYDSDEPGNCRPQ